MCCLTKRCFHYSLPFSSLQTPTASSGRQAVSHGLIGSSRHHHVKADICQSMLVWSSNCWLPLHPSQNYLSVSPRVSGPQHLGDAVASPGTDPGGAEHQCMLSSCPCSTRLQSRQSSAVSYSLEHSVPWWFASISRPCFGDLRLQPHPTIHTSTEYSTEI